MCSPCSFVNMADADYLCVTSCHSMTKKLAQGTQMHSHADAIQKHRFAQQTCGSFLKKTCLTAYSSSSCSISCLSQV